MLKGRRVEEITDVLTPEGIARLKVGQVLMFDYEGSRNELKISRIKHGRVWARPIQTVLPNQVLVDGESLDKASELL